MIFLKNTTTFIRRIILVTFFWFYEKCVANEGDSHVSFMLAKYFVISLCCVVEYPNITSDAYYYKILLLQEITGGYVKNLRPD